MGSPKAVSVIPGGKERLDNIPDTRETVVADGVILSQQRLVAPSRMEEDLRILIQTLPMRTDIEALIHRVEDAHHKEIKQVQTEI